MRANPFYELYLADRTSASDYVSFFSPILIPHVHQLFLPGNVVVVGMQGSGKSMLLALLRHETRLKYAKAGHEFPIPSELRNFMCCSVNLTHSNSTDFGNRRWSDTDPIEVELLFGDFVNALLVFDLARVITSYQNAPDAIRKEVGLRAKANDLDEFARAASKSSSLKEWLGPANNLTDMQNSLDSRVQEYRAFLHHRRRTLPDKILSTRIALGDPIAECAGLLTSMGLISNQTNVFVDIDQYEELANIKSSEGTIQKVDYRSVINRALSRRDSRISYRIGSRQHSWRSHGNIMGSLGKLENERDYKYVDLDILLKRRENSSTYIFPSFAEDVFRRRMKVAGVAPKKNISIDQVYGVGLSPVEKARSYNTGDSTRCVKLEKGWSKETKERLLDLARKDPLSARLGEAWIRQKGELNLDVNDSALPWMHKPYWRKERNELALLQIASSNQQRATYFGEDDICDLSNGNILVFISINHHIWDVFLRYEALRIGLEKEIIPKIGPEIQTIGVYNSSEDWMNKLKEETGRSAERRNFVKEIGRVLGELAFSDRAMSYPGAIGFSLREDALYEFPALREFLGELSDYGNLVESSHTTKERNRAARVKWYVSPILCPSLHLPFIRTKEPYYAKVSEVLSWLHVAKGSSLKNYLATGPKAPKTTLL